MDESNLAPAPAKTQGHRHVGGLSLEGLSSFQRVLLVADGTLTTLLEVYLDEPMRVVKLLEEISIKPQLPDVPAFSGKKQVLERRILLQGGNSGRNWIYAQSFLLPERMAPDFREQLLNSSMPIGKLWLAHKTETFKEIIKARRERAGELARHFAIKEDDSLLSRTYLVYCGQLPVMVITEKFPEQYFQDKP